jgi:hypothetical protein
MFHRSLSFILITTAPMVRVMVNIKSDNIK